MRGRDIFTLYRYELRASLRERSVIINSIVVPIVLYPLLLWVIFSGFTLVAGQTEAFVSRIAVEDVPPRHQTLLESLREQDKLELVTWQAEDGERAVREGELDAWVELLPPGEEAASLDGNFRVRIVTNSSRERSVKARQRLTEILDRYRTEWLEREARAAGLGEADWQVFTLRSENRASEQEMGALLLGLMLPIFFVIMVAVACIHPAVDATAGERERNTWETTMTLGTSRLNVVTAKYLQVTTFGLLAGILNLSAMTLSMRSLLAPLLEEEGTVAIRIPLAALPVLALGALLLAAFVAAGMMLLAAFARTFREGQSMIVPFYMVILVPLMFLGQEGLELSPSLALLPVVNVALAVREAIQGTFQPLEIALTVAVQVILIGLMLRLATSILRVEDVMTGCFEGNLLHFLKLKLRGREGVGVGEG